MTEPLPDLFPGFDFDAHRPPEPEEKLSAGRRRTQRQLEALRAGQHPLGLPLRVCLPLHPDAPPVDDRKAEGPRCGDCRFRELMHGGANSYPKCLRGWDGDRHKDPPWASHGGGTDVRSWWGACKFWEPVPTETVEEGAVTIEIEVEPDGLGIISLRPEGVRIDHVQVGASGAGGFSLADADGKRVWQMRFLSEDGPVGVLDVVYISPDEVEVATVPGGPVVRHVELVPQT